MDRGYSSSRHVNAAAKVGARHLGCVIKTFSPFKPVDDKHPVAASNFHIFEDGVASTYYCKYQLSDGSWMVISCFRNGSGKLVHMQSALVDFNPFAYDWEHVGVDRVPVKLTAAEEQLETNFTALESRL